MLPPSHVESNGGDLFGAPSSAHFEAASDAAPGREAEEQAKVAATVAQQNHSQNRSGEVLPKPEAESCTTPEAVQQSQQTGSSAAEQTAADTVTIPTTESVPQ